MRPPVLIRPHATAVVLCVCRYWRRVWSYGVATGCPVLSGAVRGGWCAHRGCVCCVCVWCAERGCVCAHGVRGAGFANRRELELLMVSSPTLLPYALAMPCPVLTRLSGTDATAMLWCYPVDTQCPVLA
eukprot:2382209-Rhodomonas_salina.2